MARIRTIKPEFFTSEDIVSVTPLARLFYVSLWCESDREGRLEWKPGTFKMRYLPGDACDVAALAGELVGRGLLHLYEVEGKRYALIPTFKKHQVINNRESESELPAPSSDASGTRASRVKAEGKEGREGKGKEGKEGEARKRAAPAVLVSVSEMVAEGVNEQHATDWLIARKAKDLPLTPTAWAQTKAEAVKAGLTIPEAIKTAAANGWAGFKASWLEQVSTHRGFDPPKTVPSAAADATAAYLAEQAQRGSTAPPKAVLEALKALRVVA